MVQIMPMPARLAVDRDALKMLVLSVGCTEAAKQTGINLNTVLALSARGKWLKPALPALPLTVQQPPAINAIKPVDALQKVISDRKQQTRAGLSKYCTDAAQKLDKSKGELRLSRPAKDIADIMTKLWPEQTSGSGGLNLQLLTGQVAIQYNTGPASQD